MPGLHSIACVFAVIASASAVAADAPPAQGRAAGKAKAATCAQCHGPDGSGGVGPKLAGQIPEYLAEQLADFQSGKRKNPIMGPIAKPLKPEDIKDLVAYYASLPAKPAGATSKESVTKGERVYRGGIAQSGVPACMGCHGPAGHGIPPRFPRVSGQIPAYTERQLTDFKAGQRIDDEGIMINIASRLSEADIKAVSAYIAGLH